jgi:hypothetical protein
MVMMYFRFLVEGRCGSFEVYEKAPDEVSATLRVYEEYYYDDVYECEEISEEEYEENA